MANKKTALLILALAVIGLAFILYKGGFTLKAIAPGDKVTVFEPVYGQLKCQYINQPEPVIPLGGQFAKCIKNVCGGDFAEGTSLLSLLRNSREWTYTYYKFFECPSGSGSRGCNLKIRDFGSLPSNCKVHYKIEPGGAWQLYTDRIFFGDEGGKSYSVKFACYAEVGKQNYQINNIPLYDFTKDARRIQATSSDPYFKPMTIQSPDCTFVSGDASRLKQKQSTDLNLIQQLLGQQVDDIQQVTQLDLEIVKPIVIDWKPNLRYADLNLLEYKGEYVICKPFDGMYKLKELTTYTTLADGTQQKYYVRGDPVLTWNTNKGMCCDANQCSGDLVCENFECVAKPTICQTTDGYTGEQCNPIRRGTVIEPAHQIVGKDGNFYSRITRCEDNLCVRNNDFKIECTAEICAKSGQFCDEKSGCFKVDYAQDCPSGQCCFGSDKYKPRNCPSPQTCCKDGKLNDPSRGYCQDSCDPLTQKPENEYNNGCKNGVDDDKDELIDNADPDCYTCVVNGKEVTAKTQIECCGKQGGVWTTATDKPPFWKFWAGETQREYCDTSKIPITAVIIGLSVLLAGGGLIYYFNKGRR